MSEDLLQTVHSLTDLWKSEQNFDGPLCSVVMEGQQEKPASGAPSILQFLLADSKNGKLGVYFITDSFLMGEEAEAEPVTWHLQLSGCVQFEF